MPVVLIEEHGAIDVTGEFCGVVLEQEVNKTNATIKNFFT